MRQTAGLCVFAGKTGQIRWGAVLLCKQEVTGSIPVGSTDKGLKVVRFCSQADRTQEVAGSSPASSIYKDARTSAGPAAGIGDDRQESATI
jgi:hypothetical protein